MSITKEDKQKIISEFAINKKDTGSAEVQIAVISERINNLTEHFTHAPSTSMIDDSTATMYDRKLDYLFTNGIWENTSSITHQADWELSDHLPVSAVLDLGG